MTTSDDLASVNPSGRVQVIPNPIASPGQCGMCGTPSHPVGFADPRLDFEFYGTLIFCKDCVGDIASVFGYLPTEALIGLREQVEDQNAELNTLRQAVLGLEAAVDGIASYNASRGRMFDTRESLLRTHAAAVNESVELPPKPDVKEPDGLDAELAYAGADEESAVDEPSVVEGRDDVRGSTVSNADIDELINL